MYSKTHDPPLPPCAFDTLHSTFQKKKGKKKESRRTIRYHLPLPNSESVWQCNVTPDVIDQAWNKGLSGPLRIVQREIASLAESQASGLVRSPPVVVSGGSARNPAVKSRLRRLCDGTRGVRGVHR